ncbi:hypothetical protein [Flavobacterium macrobrachii]|jgi:hypothetical protein|uniref:hypothetical protein n=1 Tax=Flavobacterium macrobrachii TaxID=591204 RepID=UPI0037C10AB3
MNKALKIIGSIFLVYIIVFSCNKLISSKLKSDIDNSPYMQHLDAKSELRQATNIINSEMPVKVDDQTTVVKAEYLENENKFILYYQVTGFNKGDKTTEEMNSLIETLKSSQLDNVRNNPNNKTFVKERVTFEYIYKDVNDSIFCSYQIMPNEYISN